MKRTPVRSPGQADCADLLRSELGRDAILLPGNWKPVNFSLGDGGNRSVVIAIEEDDGGITIVYSTIWLDDPRSRRLVFIAPSENARLGAVMLKVVPEFRRD